MAKDSQDHQNIFFEHVSALTPELTLSQNWPNGQTGHLQSLEGVVGVVGKLGVQHPDMQLAI